MNSISLMAAFWNVHFIILFIQIKLLQKDANIRLGSPDSPFGEITENIFFHEMDWKKLERKQLETPFKPDIVRTVKYSSSTLTY